LKGCQTMGRMITWMQHVCQFYWIFVVQSFRYIEHNRRMTKLFTRVYCCGNKPTSIIDTWIGRRYTRQTVCFGNAW
jgi:formate dehydrogenase maturation protein FdhE